MKEIKSLFERADKYLRSAAVLIKEEDYESAVSRVYYAMFYSIEALLLSRNLTFSSHKGAISAFGEQFVKSGILPKTMSKSLNEAFEKRQIGEYEYTFVIPKDDAEKLLVDGKEFVKVIKEYLKGTNLF
jgi:uncharacterized protein (UPF0332 family)